MKFVFKLIKIVFILIFFLILFVTLPIALMYKSSTPPEINEGGVFNVQESFKEQLDFLIDPSIDDKEIAFHIEEDYINHQIYLSLVNAMNDKLSTEYGYIFELSPNILVQGVWVSFADDVISVNVGAHFRVLDITYKTHLHLSFKVLRIDSESLVLKIDKFKVGNFSLKWLIRVAPEIAKHISGFDLDSLIEQMFFGLGSYNNKKQEVNIDLNNLFKMLFNENDLIGAVSGLLDNKDFFYMGTVTKESKNYFKIGFNLNDMYDETNDFNEVLPDDEKFQTEEDLTTFMEQRVFVGVIKQSIDFTETDITNLLNYLIKQDSESDNNLVTSVPILEEYQLDVFTPYFKIDKDAYLNIPVRFGKNNNYFSTNLKIELRFTKQSNDLILSFKSFNFGNLIVDNKLVELLFSMIQIPSITFTNNTLVFKDFFELFSDDESFGVLNIRVDKDLLKINLIPIDIDGMFDDIIMELPNEEFGESIREIYDKIKNEGNLKEEDFNDLINDFDKLTDEEKEILFDLIKDYTSDKKDEPILGDK